MKKIARNIIIISITFLVLFSQNSFIFADNITSITGYVMEIKDEQDNNKTLKGLKNMSLRLIDTNNKDKVIETTTTSSKGQYSFSNVSDLKNYRIEIDYPNVTEKEINDIETVEDAKKIQKKLKINGQDYYDGIDEKEAKEAPKEKNEKNDEESTSNIKVKSTKNLSADAQVLLVLDASHSMEWNDESPTRIVSLRKMAQNIIEGLYESKREVAVGIIKFCMHKQEVVTDPIKDKNKLINYAKNLSVIQDDMGTQIAPGLKIANQFFDEKSSEKNRFVFLLTDGQSSDGQEMKNEIKKLKEKNVIVVGVLINQQDFQDLKDACGGNTYQRFAKFNDKFKKYINTYVSKVKELVEENVIKKEQTSKNQQQKEGEEVEDTEKDTDQSKEEKEKKEFDGTFDYSNTYFYKALDMNIKTPKDVTQFKEYAKELRKETLKTISSSTIELNSSAGPNFYLKKREEYTIKPTLKLTNMNITLNNGVVQDNISLKNSLKSNKNSTLFATVKSEYLYGSKVTLAYQLQIKNESEYKDTKNISLLYYLPKDFYIEPDKNKYVKFYNKNDNTSVNFDSKNFEFVKIDSRNINKYNNMLSEKAKNLLSNGGSALIINLNLENQKVELKKDDYIKLFFDISKFLSYSPTDDDDNYAYYSEVEICSYKNDSKRRLQYNSVGAVAGNHVYKDIEDTEKDYAMANGGLVNIPTGVDVTLLVIVSAVMIILELNFAIVILCIKNRKIKKNILN